MQCYDGTECSAMMVPIHALQWYRFADTVNNWIDGFDNGLARVKIGGVTNGINESKWGLIDEEGEVSCL